MELGTVEGAVNTERFAFEAHREIEKFDFVTVKANTDEAEWLLAQVNELEKQPLKDEEKVDSSYKTVANASIIGYRYKGMLKKPRSVIKPGSIVYQADQRVISDVLGLDSEGLYIGKLITNPDINIYLDPEELYKHFAVLAKTGYGKSYATAVVVEELLEKDYPVIVIDPHGEYHTLGRKNDLDDEMKETFDIESKRYRTEEFSPNTDLNEDARKLSFSSKNMDAKEIQQVVPTNLTNSQLGVLYTALKELKEKHEYTLDELIDRCMDQDSKAKWNLVNMLEAVRDSGLFEEDYTEPQELLDPGKATVINLKGVDPEHQEATVFKLAKELFEKRKHGELEPFIMIIEEAHNFVPEKGMGKAVCSDILRKIASEGRKFGLGIGVISQRPANVAKNILSQCNTQLILRVTNPNDLKAIAKSFEGVTSQVRDSITSLATGVGLVLGKEYPILTNIRTRRSLHGGGTKELSDKGDTNDPEPVSSPVSGETQDDDEEEPEERIEDDEEEESIADEVEEEQRITAFKTDLATKDAEHDYGSIKTVLYPYWVARTSIGTVIVDGKDGAITERRLKLTDEAETVLDTLDKPLTKEAIVERTAIEEKDIDDIIDQMIDLELVKETGGKVRKNETPLLEHGYGTRHVRGGKTLDIEVDEDKAAEIVESSIGKTPDKTTLVYRLYYRTGDEVIDAVTGDTV